MSNRFDMTTGSVMRRVAGIAVLYLICSAAWQIGKSELANIELRDDMRDMASQLGARIGLTSASTDEDFRKDVVRKAKKYGIQLAPEQVTVQRTGQGAAAYIYLAADYSVPIRLPGVSFQRHLRKTDWPKTGLVQSDLFRDIEIDSAPRDIAG